MEWDNRAKQPAGWLQPFSAAACRPRLETSPRRNSCYFMADYLAFPGPRNEGPQQFKDAKLSGRIIDVMALLPATVKFDNGRPTVRAARGNLALYSSFFYLQQHTEWETHLVGWGKPLVDGKDTEKLLEETLLQATTAIQDACGKNVHPVWAPAATGTNQWKTYCDEVLWPVFHYIMPQPSDGRAEHEAWREYVRLNEMMFYKVKELYKPGDLIWVHDYHLLLLPQLLRMEFPDAVIGLFVHIPFPSSEYFRGISKRLQLLDGMLGANVVGFQSQSFARHFVSCCARVLGHEVAAGTVLAYSLHIAVDSLPIGIDVDKIEHDAFSEAVEEKVKALRAVYAGKSLIVGRDRLDSVRGVVQKLEAYETFLEMYPEWRGKVVLIQVLLHPELHQIGQTRLAAQTNLVQRKVDELVSRINNIYGSLNYAPVVHYLMRVDREEYLALLRAADVAVVASVRDGMNTTALEYVVCQRHSAAPLVLSEFTGTSTVLQDAALVNPWDAVGVAKALHDSLTMSESDRAASEQRLYKQVSSNTVQQWTNAFVSRLVQQALQDASEHTHHTPALDRPLVYKCYQKASKRLFFFDYDGTLVPIVRDPAAAIPSARLSHLLDTLAADPKNQIWVISGRDQAFLGKWLGDKKLGLSAEHGCFMRHFGATEWINLAAETDMSWQEVVEECFRRYTEKTPGSHIERKKVALTWHYRRADPELGRFQAEKCQKELEDTVATRYDVEVMAGKANIEVRPRFLNKGEIVKRLMALHGDNKDAPEFVLCLGDDRTDEDMFRSLLDVQERWHKSDKPKNAVSGTYGIFPVAVGPASKQTVATAHLSDPAQVLETLGLLTGDVSLADTAGCS